MPEPTAPGVCLEENPDYERSIPAAPASITAFIGRTRRGPVNRPVFIYSLHSFQRFFGGVWRESPLSHAVQQYFENGGHVAVIVRVSNGGNRTTIDLPSGADVLVLEANSPGSDENLRVSVDYDGIGDQETDRFNMVVQRVRHAGSELVEDQEFFTRLSIRPESKRYVADLLLGSQLLRVRGDVPAARPDRTLSGRPGAAVAYIDANADGSDGEPLTDYDVIGSATDATGLFALSDIEQFNLLCIPALSPDRDAGPMTLLAAARYCVQRKAMLIVDPPADWHTADEACNGLRRLNFASENAALFYPRVFATDPETAQKFPIGPCGVVAGMIARGDERASLWQALTGEGTPLRGTRPVTTLESEEVDMLGSAGINAIAPCRTSFAVAGRARTLAPEDWCRSGWSDFAARRTALYIIGSLERGTRWVVFEKNEARVWARVHNQVTEFLHELYKEGAFLGDTPEQAYFVKCDADTTTASDVEREIVHFVVGFALASPGHYFVFNIAQGVGESRVTPVGLDVSRYHGSGSGQR
ncbi:MAG TPA: phage tail sheath family protein [Gammaproteobacteria bacterium]|nr:phage tail sheath family protein [Gammaproteobacteria bacterium]